MFEKYKMKIKLITLFMNMNLTKDKSPHCVNCNYYMKAKSHHYCQLFPTFEYIDMYKYIKTNENNKNNEKKTQIENINNIPHEYYTCDIARTSSHLCNGNNFSKLIHKN